MGQGHDEQSAYGICYAAVVEGKSDAIKTAADCGFSLYESDIDAIKAYWAGKYAQLIVTGAVKAVGDWELDVLAVPFGKPDSDGQTFDAATDFMLDTFTTPAVFYHHGVMPGKKSLQQKPVIVGKTTGVEVKSDGVHLRVLLDRTLEWAKRIWDAAKNGLAVVSSDSIAHLARLEVGGKRIMYEKGRPGRIAVWPLAGVSLWDRTQGNFTPASRHAIALPAMKAIYRDAGIQFPDIGDTSGVVPEADEAARRARIQKIIQTTKIYLEKTG